MKKIVQLAFSLIAVLSIAIPHYSFNAESRETKSYWQQYAPQFLQNPIKAVYISRLKRMVKEYSSLRDKYRTTEYRTTEEKKLEYEKKMQKLCILRDQSIKLYNKINDLLDKLRDLVGNEETSRILNESEINESEIGEILYKAIFELENPHYYCSNAKKETPSYWQQYTPQFVQNTIKAIYTTIYTYRLKKIIPEYKITEKQAQQVRNEYYETQVRNEYYETDEKLEVEKKLQEFNILRKQSFKLYNRMRNLIIKLENLVGNEEASRILAEAEGL